MGENKKSSLFCGLKEYAFLFQYLLELVQLKVTMGVLMSQKGNTGLLRGTGIAWKLPFQMPYALISNMSMHERAKQISCNCHTLRVPEGNYPSQLFT